MKELSLHILDIVQNAIDAGAGKVSIHVEENLVKNSFDITISDNGRGMTKETLDQVTDPYFTSRKTRKVGMGIPLLLHTVKQAGGNLDIESEPGKGTTIRVRLMHNHIDRPVMGDMAGVVSMLCGANPDMDFTYVHVKDEKRYEFDTREVKEVLEGMSISELPVVRYLKEMIRENLGELINNDRA